MLKVTYFKYSKFLVYNVYYIKLKLYVCIFIWFAV